MEKQVSEKRMVSSSAPTSSDQSSCSMEDTLCQMCLSVTLDSAL